MTGALLKRFARYARRFWLPNPSSPKPLRQSSAHSSGFLCWSAPTRWIWRSLRRSYPRRRRCESSGRTAPTLRRPQKTAGTWRKSSRLWQRGAAFLPRPGRRSIVKSPSVRTKRCARVVRTVGEARRPAATMHAACCIRWHVGRVSARICGKSLGHIRRERPAKRWKNVQFSKETPRKSVTVRSKQQILTNITGHNALLLLLYGLYGHDYTNV